MKRLVFSFCCVLLIGACSSTKKDSMNESDSGLVDSNIALDDKARFPDGGSIPLAKGGGLFPDIFFEYDSFSIPENHEGDMDRIASTLRSRPELHVEVEGHCDKRGTNEYNMALGEKRAKSVSSNLISKGVSRGQLSTVSYGEEIPLDPGEGESSFAKNRRAHFAVFQQK
jgi:peptidoglycan-associated lipoprotein